MQLLKFNNKERNYEERGGTKVGQGWGNFVFSNVVVTIELSMSSSLGAMVDAENASLPGLNSEQWKTLMKMLSYHKQPTSEKIIDKHKSSTGIINTGASKHIAGRLQHMYEVWKMPECSVGLPMNNILLQLKDD